MSAGETGLSRRGRRLSLVIVGVAIFWLLASLLGREYDWSHRTRALFDLIALAGFGWAFILAIGLWRARQSDRH